MDGESPVGKSCLIIMAGKPTAPLRMDLLPRQLCNMTTDCDLPFKVYN